MQIRQDFLTEIQQLIAASKEAAIRSVDHHRVLLYWHIGQKIFEEEQGAKERADYGAYLLKFLSEELEPVHGSGFSRRQLELCRQFYRTFPIANTLYSQLSWSQYKLLVRIESEEKRNFYLAETKKNNWTVRQLERQINSQLFERLLASKDVASVLAVARSEKQPSDAKDIIKDPIVLEFLGLQRETAYYERDLESALITHLQEFMLELGNGFSFVARQKRIHLEGDEFFVDLIFYNRLLQCFVLVEIKTQKLTHQDLGQLQMYVNYYDRVEKLAFENPTIGILLCADKNDAVVRFSLPEHNKQIVASKYQLYLPSEKQLIEEVKNTLRQAQDDKENIEQTSEEKMTAEALSTPNRKRQTPNNS